MIESYNRFRGRPLLISTSVPLPNNERYHRVPRARLEIEEAIVGLARAAFSRGNRIVYGGNLSTSLLLTMVAAEYITPRYAEGRETDARFSNDAPREEQTPIIIYQSELTRGETPELEIMDRLGYVNVRWVSSDERRNIDSDSFSNTTLRQMIEESNPVAMICIGGMGDVERAVRVFREIRPRLPVYLMATTGGAAEEISNSSSEFPNMRVVDRELLDDLKRRRREFRADRGTDEPLEFRYTPYALIMQKLISEIGGDDRLG